MSSNTSMYIWVELGMLFGMHWRHTSIKNYALAKLNHNRYGQYGVKSICINQPSSRPTDPTCWDNCSFPKKNCARVFIARVPLEGFLLLFVWLHRTKNSQVRHEHRYTDRRQRANGESIVLAPWNYVEVMQLIAQIWAQLNQQDQYYLKNQWNQLQICFKTP